MKHVLVLLFALLLLVGCSTTVFESYIPTQPISDYYIDLSGGRMFLGQELLDTSMYTQDDEEAGRCIQTLGLYDIKVVNNHISEIRTASREIKLASDLYVGQTLASLESYLINTVKYELQDRVCYYDVINKTVIEVKYDKELRVEVIRFSCLMVKE